MRPIYKTMAPDEDQGGGGGIPAAPQVDVPIPPGPEGQQAAPAQPAPAAPSPEQFDYRSGFEQLAASFKESQAAHQAELQRIRELFHQTFDPQGYAKGKEPRYATVDQIQGALRQHRDDIRAEQLVASFQTDLGAAREKYADLFDAYPGAEAAIREEWAKSKTGESVMSIAKRFDTALSKAWEARQKKYMEEKQKQGEGTKSTLKGGTPPKPNGAESTARGFGRIREALRKAGSAD